MYLFISEMAVNASLTSQCSNISSQCANLTIMGKVTERSWIVVSTLLFVSVWIIIINGLTFSCLLSSRRKLKNFIYIQMLSYSLTDMFVGICAVPVVLTYHITHAFPTYVTCVGIIYSYFVAQGANLYHGFTICVHRIIIVKRSAGRIEKNPRNIARTIILQVCSTWIIPAVLMFILFAYLGRFRETMNECSTNNIFENKYVYFVGAMNVIFLIPHIGMNVVYVYMLWFLFATWQTISKGRNNTRPNNDQTNSALIPSNGTNNTNDGSNGENNDRVVNAGIMSNIESATLDEHKNTVSVCNDCNEDNIFGESVKKVSAQRLTNDKKLPLKAFICFQESSESSGFDSRISSIEVKSCDALDRTLQAPGNRTHFRLQNRHSLNSQATSNRLDKTRENTEHNKKAFVTLNRKASKHEIEKKLGFRGQKEVLVTIGMILFVVNIFMTPFNLLIVFEALNGGDLSRETKSIIMSMSLINSALNPVIYTLRIKPFRVAFAQNLRVLISKIMFK